MKLGQRVKSGAHATNPDKNYSKKNMLLIGVIVVTVLLIVWVFMMGRKAEETVSVVMWANSIYKNQTITESSMVEYPMIKAEFEKYAVEKSDGSKSRRIVLWEERGKIINTFAAYPLQANTVAMIKDVVKTKVDNSDTVLYSYPGKNIVSFDLGNDALNTFKTFLQPGDRVHITGLYSTTDKVESDDGFGNMETEDVETLRQETIFKDIMIADLLNKDGESVLDLFAYYNDLTVYQQAALDADEEWKAKTEPSTLLVALTPEEEAMYYEYLAKNDIEFKMSLPQRTE